MTVENNTETKTPNYNPKNFVTSQARALQQRYLDQDSAARAVLARLRRAESGEPGTAWDVAEYLVPENLPNEVSTEPYGTSWADRSEIAAHIAMTSFANMQQSKSIRMHVEKKNLGQAARELAQHHDEHMDNNKVWERVAKIAQAESVAGLQRHLRNLTSLLSRRDIGLDFGVLAEDLYFWQNRATRSAVQRRWSRSFFSTPTNHNNQNDK